MQAHDLAGLRAYGESLVLAALNGHIDVFRLLYNQLEESIKSNLDLWVPYLDQALFYAVAQNSTHEECEGSFSIAQFLLNQQF